MISRALFAMLVGALLAAPSALAMLGEPQTDLSLVDVAPKETSLPDAPVKTVAIPDAPLDVEATLKVATDPLACRQALKVPVAIMYGDITHQRPGSGDLLRTPLLRTVEWIETPVLETVTKTLWQPSGLLGALPAVTRDVQEVVRVELVEQVTLTPVPTTVHLTWQEHYWDYDQVVFPILLDLPVALPFMDEGELVTVCQDETIFPEVPTFPDHQGHDYYTVCIGCTDERPDAYDGWTIGVLTSVARLGAAKQDIDWYHTSLSTRDLLDRTATATAQNFVDGLDLVDVLAEDAGSADAAGTDAAGTTPAVSGGSVMAAVLGTLGSLGAVGTFLGRRFL